MKDFHEPWCRYKEANHEDAVKRLADHYNLHRVASGIDSVGKWIAVALADGASDGVLYNGKQEAVRHQHHNERYYTFIKIVPSTMTLCEANVMMVTARKLYEKGMRMADPDHRSGGPEVIKRTSIEDVLAVAAMRPTNLRWPGERQVN